MKFPKEVCKSIITGERGGDGSAHPRYVTCQLESLNAQSVEIKTRDECEVSVPQGLVHCVPHLLCTTLPGPLCPSPSVYQAHCVPTWMCTWPNVSQALCVTGPLCPSHNVYQAQRVPHPLCPTLPGSLCPSPSVYLAQYVPTWKCTRPNVSQALCVKSVPGPVCPRTFVSNAHCVPVPMCPSPNVYQAQRVTGPLCPSPNVYQAQCVSFPG